MARAPVHRMSLFQRPRAEQLAARDIAIAKIEAALREEPRTITELHAIIGGPRPTVFCYLRHMHKTLRTVHMTDQRRDRCALWAMGEDPTLPSPDEMLDKIIAPKRGAGPARQLGMWRDPLVAALFGPAEGAAA